MRDSTRLHLARRRRPPPPAIRLLPNHSTNFTPRLSTSYIAFVALVAGRASIAWLAQATCWAFKVQGGRCSGADRRLFTSLFIPLCSRACRTARKRCRSVAIYKATMLKSNQLAYTISQLLRDLVRCGRQFPVVNFSQCALPSLHRAIDLTLCACM